MAGSAAPTAVAALCCWVRAMHSYHTFFQAKKQEEEEEEEQEGEHEQGEDEEEEQQQAAAPVDLQLEEE